MGLAVTTIVIIIVRRFVCAATSGALMPDLDADFTDTDTTLTFSFDKVHWVSSVNSLQAHS
jgi:hypothetical protein